MAEKRMFAKSIVLSDAFLDMPMSARCLYFTLGMLADDDGFVGSPKAIMRQCGASNDDLLLLLSKRFVLGFDTGVIVIKHWRINNYLQNDRIKPTTYVEEMATLMLDQKGAYKEKTDTGNVMYTKCIHSIDENSIDENRVDKMMCDAHFTPPSFEEVSAYCVERGNRIDPQRFIDYYNERKWYLVNGKKMSDWKVSVRNWERRDGFRPKETKTEISDEEDEKNREELMKLIKEMNDASN